MSFRSKVESLGISELVAGKSIGRCLGLIARLTLVAMTNGRPDTAFEESVLLRKLGVCLMLVIPLACHVPLRFDPQCPLAIFLHLFLLGLV